MSRSDQNTYDILGSVISILISVVIGSAAFIASSKFDTSITSPVISYILGLSATALALILVETIYSGRVRNKQTADIINEISKTSSMRVFKTSKDGLRSNIYDVKRNTVTEIYNTVLRYGNAESSHRYGKLYKKWINAKEKALSRDRCYMKEIISTHIGKNETDQQMTFVNNMHYKHANYEDLYIDDVSHPMISVTITKFANRESQVLFGYEYPGIGRGLCFKSTDGDVVEYFMSYFRKWEGKCQTPSDDNDYVSGDWYVYRYLNREKIFIHCDKWSITRNSCGDHNIEVTKLIGIDGKFLSSKYDCIVVRFGYKTLNILINGKEHPQQSLVCFTPDVMPSMMIGLGAGSDFHHDTCARIYFVYKGYDGFDHNKLYEYAELFIEEATDKIKNHGKDILYMPKLEQIISDLESKGIKQPNTDSNLH
jgi:hypothetical protein